MTLSDALTHRDEPSAVLDSESRRSERDERIATDEDGDRYKRETVERGERQREKERVRKSERRGRERGRDRYRRFPVSCHVLRRAFELYEETPSMNYS